MALADLRWPAPHLTGCQAVVAFKLVLRHDQAMTGSPEATRGTTLTCQSCSSAMAGYHGSLRSDGLARDRWDTLDAPAGWAAALEAPADGAA
jgi:hypothetical protein